MLDVGEKLGLEVIPCAILNDQPLPTNKANLRGWVATLSGLHSTMERCEGIVVRSDPQMFTRRGDRVAWKLKFKDFA